MLTLTLVLRPGFICSDSDSNSKCVCAYTPSYVMCYFVSADAVTHEDWQWLLSRGDRAPSEPNLPLDHTHTTLPLNLACMCLLPLTILVFLDHMRLIDLVSRAHRSCIKCPCLLPCLPQACASSLSITYVCTSPLSVTCSTSSLSIMRTHLLFLDHAQPHMLSHRSIF